MKQDSRFSGKAFKLNIKEKFIILTDNDCVKKSDAIILLEGDGVNRYKKVVELYHHGYANKIVFSGGITDYEYGSIPFHEIFPLLVNSGVPSHAISHEDKSQNTRDQATEIIKLSVENSWHRLILVASNYHQYRAYLTFIKELLTKNSDIIIFNAPASDLKWFETNRWGARIDLLEAEFAKIEKYTELGHLATYEEAIRYQIWKEKQV